VVRKEGENGSTQYEILIGHRRAFVSKFLGREVPCFVWSYEPEGSWPSGSPWSAARDPRAMDNGEGPRTGNAQAELARRAHLGPSLHPRRAHGLSNCRRAPAALPRDVLVQEDSG